MVVLQNDGVPEGMLLALRHAKSPLYRGELVPTRPHLRPTSAYAPAPGMAAPRCNDGGIVLRHRWWRDECPLSLTSPIGSPAGSKGSKGSPVFKCSPGAKGAPALSGRETAHLAADGSDEVDRVIAKRVRQRELELAQKDRDKCQKRVDALMGRLEKWARADSSGSKELARADLLVGVRGGEEDRICATHWGFTSPAAFILTHLLLCAYVLPSSRSLPLPCPGVG